MKIVSVEESQILTHFIQAIKCRAISLKNTDKFNIIQQIY